MERILDRNRRHRLRNLRAIQKRLIDIVSKARLARLGFVSRARSEEDLLSDQGRAKEVFELGEETMRRVWFLPGNPAFPFSTNPICGSGENLLRKRATKITRNREGSRRLNARTSFVTPHAGRSATKLSGAPLCRFREVYFSKTTHSSRRAHKICSGEVQGATSVHFPRQPLESNASLHKQET